MKIICFIVVLFVSASLNSNPLAQRLIINQFITPNSNYDVKNTRVYGVNNKNKIKVQKMQIQIFNAGWKYRGTAHPVTKVEYSRHGFPKFESKHNFKLPVNLLSANNSVQFRSATRSLRRKIEINPALAKQFTPNQLKQIRQGLPKIDGLTWHHHQSKSVGLQLIDEAVHNATPHTGGNAIWNL